MGVILGTAAYMSPEQARGKPVDRRADIWAFACVIYEMLTGQRAFPGEDATETIAAVVRSEPDWTRLPDGLTPIQWVFLRRCFQKDPSLRVGDVRDLRLALEGAYDPPAAAAAPPAPAYRANAWPAVAAALVVAGIVGAALAAWTLGSGHRAVAELRPLRRFASAIPTAQTLPAAIGTLVGVSPDGQTIVYRAVENGTERLYRRSLDEVEATPIAGANAIASYTARVPFSLQTASGWRSSPAPRS